MYHIYCDCSGCERPFDLTVAEQTVVDACELEPDSDKRPFFIQSGMQFSDFTFDEDYSVEREAKAEIEELLAAGTFPFLVSCSEGDYVAFAGEPDMTKRMITMTHDELRNMPRVDAW